MLSRLKIHIIVFINLGLDVVRSTGNLSCYDNNNKSLA